MNSADFLQNFPQISCSLEPYFLVFIYVGFAVFPSYFPSLWMNSSVQENTTFYPGNSTRLIAIVFGNLLCPPLYSITHVPVMPSFWTILAQIKGTGKKISVIDTKPIQNRTGQNPNSIPVPCFWNYWFMFTASSSSLSAKGKISWCVFV